MREIFQFSEEKFINMFVSDLKTKAFCFTDIDFSFQYIENEIKPMTNIVDFMFTHHFISEKGYFQCKNIYNETIQRGMKALEKKYEREVVENNKQPEQRKAEK